MVVEANPKNPDGTPNHSEAFWMRTIPSEGCHNFQDGGIPNGREGIVYYKQGSTAYPLTAPGNYSHACRDEPFEKLRPVLAEGWVVPKPGPLGKLQLLYPLLLLTMGKTNPMTTCSTLASILQSPVRDVHCQATCSSAGPSGPRRSTLTLVIRLFLTLRIRNGIQTTS